MGLFDRLFRRGGEPPAAPSPAAEPAPPAEPPGPPVLLAGNIQGVGDREGQEDSFALSGVSDREGQETRGLLALVADGMGGMEDGKTASQCAVDALLEAFSRWEEGRPVPDWLYTQTLSASRQVFDRCGGRGGTTLIAVHILGDALHWASVGDSAIFLKRGGGVFQLNREHTYLNRLYDQALEETPIQKSRAELDPDARRLTAFVGMEQLAEVDLSLRPWRLRRGDVVLLCSDGVSGVLTPPELLEAMSLPPAEGCALLETLVLEKQLPGQDNYTGVMIAYQ